MIISAILIEETPFNDLSIEEIEEQINNYYYDYKNKALEIEINGEKGLFKIIIESPNRSDRGKFAVHLTKIVNDEQEESELEECDTAERVVELIKNIVSE